MDNCNASLSLEGRRWDEQAGSQVTFDEMVAFLSDQELDENQLKAHWASLSSANQTTSTDVPTPPMPPTDPDTSQSHSPLTPTGCPPSLTEQIGVTAGAELPAPTTPHSRVPVIVAQSPLKRKRVPVRVEGQNSNGNGKARYTDPNSKYNFGILSNATPDIPFADNWAPRDIYEKMCGCHTSTCMLVAWQSDVIESTWGGKFTGRVEIHAYGLDADNGWVRISGYEKEKHGHSTKFCLA